MVRRIKLFTTVFWLACVVPVAYALAQKKQDFQFPFVQNYSKLHYQAGNQNWSIAKGRDGVMYYGNSKAIRGRPWSGSTSG